MVRDRRSNRHGFGAVLGSKVPGVSSKKQVTTIGDEPTDHYSVVSVLGQGNFGQVSLVTQKRTGQKYAMKHIDLARIGGGAGGANINLYLTLREIELMKRMDHPNVVKLFEVFRDDGNIHMILELCLGGELEEVLGNLPPLPTTGGGLPDAIPRFPEAQAKALIVDMLSALSYIHGNG